jgi:hypothetical protein
MSMLHAINSLTTDKIRDLDMLSLSSSETTQTAL